MTVRPERSPSLGRGLAALIPQRAAGQPGPTEIALDRIRPNPAQPRVRFDPAELETLTGLIRQLLQKRLLATTRQAGLDRVEIEKI